MLTFLSIRNLPLIPKLDVELGKGFNVITGETGAGKSVVVEALSFLLGGRLRTGVQAGSEPLSVQGTFSVDQKSLAAALREHGAGPEDGEVTLRRESESDGKTRAFINGAKFPLHTLKSVASLLVDVHGQHDNQALFDPAEHRRLVDAFAGAGETLHHYRETFLQLKEKTEKLETIEKEERSILAQKEFLEFQQKELNQAELGEGREQALLDKIRRAESWEKVAELSTAVRTHLSENLISELKAGLKALTAFAKIDSRCAPLLETVEELLARAGDLSARLPTSSASGEEKTSDTDALNEALALLGRLKRKYQRDEAGLVTLLSEVASKLDLLNTVTFEKTGLQKEIGGLRRTQEKQVAELSRLRRAAAIKFDHRVGELLKAMNMADAAFSTRLNPAPAPGPEGCDEVEFLISTLPGEPAKALRQVASGGELSRTMLAIKAVLADTDRTPVLVFDEVDAGVGGETAGKIGLTLKALSRFHQIFCVTHLHQIASQADRHFSVEKTSGGKGTAVTLRPLNETERVAEVARMLGDAKSKSARDHAKSLVSGRA